MVNKILKLALKSTPKEVLVDIENPVVKIGHCWTNDQKLGFMISKKDGVRIWDYESQPEPMYLKIHHKKKINRLLKTKM